MAVPVDKFCSQRSAPLEKLTYITYIFLKIFCRMLIIVVTKDPPFELSPYGARVWDKPE